MDRDLRNKHDFVWKGRFDGLIEDLEASKLTIHNQMQEILSLRCNLQHNKDDYQRLADEAKLRLEAQIERLQREKQNLEATHRPQLNALGTQIEIAAKENSKLRHSMKVRKKHPSALWVKNGEKKVQKDL
jgi:septal ring factor EnvC (AmiA/AmiB activator)